MMRFFRLPRSRVRERLKHLIRATLRTAVRNMPLPSRAKTALHLILPYLPWLRPRWSEKSEQVTDGDSKE